MDDPARRVSLPDAFRAMNLAPLYDRGADGPRAYEVPVDLGTDVAVSGGSLTLHLPGRAIPLAGGTFAAQAMPFGVGAVRKNMPVVFVGYAIAAGPDEYLGFPFGVDLDDAAVIALRYEPLGLNGKSRWAGSGWTSAARVAGKILAASRRGAGAVLLVEPSGVLETDPDDLRSFAAGDHEEPVADLPVFALAHPYASMLVAAGHPDKRSIDDLTSLANDQGVVVPLDNVSISLHADVRREPRTGKTVGAVLAGRGALAESVVLFATLHDPSAPDEAAVILDAATRIIAGHDRSSAVDARSVAFVAFDAASGGEPAMNGFIEAPPVPLRDIHVIVTIDRVTGRDPDAITIAGIPSALELDRIVEPTLDRVPEDVGFRGRIVTERPRAPRIPRGPVADRFDRRGVPQLAVLGGENVDDAVLVAVAASAVSALARRPDRLDYQGDGVPPRELLGETGRVRVRVGIVPSADTGRADGVRVARVLPGTPAAEAGLRPRDRITSWNGVGVTTPDQWSRLLTEHAPGDRVEVIVSRRGEPRRIIVTLDAADR